MVPGITDKEKDNPVQGFAAILVDQALSYAAAEEACGELDETLWAGDNDAAALTSIKASLAYQVYQRNHEPSAKFWIAKADTSCKCRAISGDGSLHELKCSEQLPVLCSQSAAVSNATTDDTSERFQVTQEVGTAQFIGYRDFFTWKFRGIRFAPPPQRFEYSTTLRNTTGPVSALEAGADCLQPGDPSSSDDCLFLNIWTPYLPPSGTTPAKAALKPVLLYIYGGNFVGGSGKNPHLDLTNTASRGDVVGVSINHRAGNLGLLVFSDGSHNGNIATNDQISALTWVRENIASFGGDPDKITIAGESSGAMSVRLLLASPEAEGLYAGALMQSDPQGGVTQPNSIFWTPEESYNFFTRQVLNETGCSGAQDEIECLRALPGSALTDMDLNTAIAKYPVLDGKYLTTSSLPLDGSGPRFARNTPVMTGVTRDEAALLTELLAGVPWDTITFDVWLYALHMYRDFFRIDPDAIVANLPLFHVTPASTPEQLYNATINILTLTMYSCLDRAKAFSGAKNGAFEKVYAFNFHRTYSPPLATPAECSAPPTAEFPLGDAEGVYYRCHGGSALLMFGNEARLELPDRDGRDGDFSRLVVDYWTSFVRTGDPNPEEGYLVARGYESTLKQIGKVGGWGTVEPESPEWMILKWDGGMAPFGDEEVCSVLGLPLDFWESRA